MRTIDVSAAGRRGSASAMSSQPTTCEVSASVTSQPCAGQLGARSSSPSSAPGRDRDERRHERGGEQRAGGPAQVAAHVAQDEDEAGVGDARQHPEERAARRVVAEGLVADEARDEDRAAEDERHREHDARRRPLAEQQPRRDGDEHDLQVGEHGRQAGADVGDRVVPEDEVGGEERARGASRASQLPAGGGPWRRRSASASAPSTGSA